MLTFNKKKCFRISEAFFLCNQATGLASSRALVPRISKSQDGQEDEAQ